MLLLLWGTVLLAISYVLKSLEVSFHSFYCPPCKYQSVPQRTGHMKLVQPFSYWVCFQEMLGFATAVSLAAFDMEADAFASAVPGPKSLWPGSS